MVPFAGYDMPVQYPFIKENLFTRAAAGLFDLSHVLDDLMVSNQGDGLMLMVNAARKESDEAHLRRHLSSSCLIEPSTDRAVDSQPATYTP